MAFDDSGHKPSKMTYTQALKCQSNVASQNEAIGLGIHPTNELLTTWDKVIIKKKRSS